MPDFITLDALVRRTAASAPARVAVIAGEALDGAFIGEGWQEFWHGSIFAAARSAGRSERRSRTICDSSCSADVR